MPTVHEQGKIRRLMDLVKQPMHAFVCGAITAESNSVAIPGILYGAVTVKAQALVNQIATPQPSDVVVTVNEGSNANKYKVLSNNLTYSQLVAQKTATGNPIKIYLEAEFSESTIPEGVISTVNKLESVFIVSGLRLDNNIQMTRDRFINASELSNSNYIIEMVHKFSTPITSLSQSKYKLSFLTEL